ncbi:MAG: hypothetical protein V3U80_09465 [Flavobacteriaceae bacterium]
MERISVKEALLKGQVVVNFPVFLLMFGIPGLFYFTNLMSDELLWLKPFSMFLGFVLGWLWWSYAIVKWRLWAFSRVDDFYELEDEAIEAKLIWPEGNWFNKTEIWTRLQREQWEEIIKSNSEDDDF